MKKHHEKVTSETTTWLTPPWVYKALGDFDLDPCGHPKSGSATRLICLPEDGLKSNWTGRVWLNPPYGKGLNVWIDRMIAHNFGTALLPARTETVWFQSAVAKCSSALFLEKRIAFLRPDGTAVDGNTIGSVLLSFGAFDAEILGRSKLVGWWVRN